MSLDTLGDRYWLTLAEFNPISATIRGEHSFDDRLRRFDDEWLDDMAGRFRSIAAEVESLDPAALTTQERISVGLLVHECGVWATDIDLRFGVGAVDPFTGPHAGLLTATRQNTVANGEQADALLIRYARVPDYLADALRFHRISADQGMTPAMASLDRVMSQLDGYLDSGLDGDPFLQLGVPPDADPDAWMERATDLVRDVIRPAFADYRAGLRDHIAPVARPHEKCGLVWMTNGEEIYTGLIHKYTQLSNPARQIHDIGLEWATEINAAEWVEIGQRAFGATTRKDVFERLDSDPELRFSTEADMLEHATGAIDRAWDAVGSWFGARPETPCDVVPVPPETAPAMPPAYYMQPPIDGSRPGTYFLNCYKPEERGRFQYEAIHFHEAIPGHHFDRSLASALEGIPTFRRFAQVFAHTEGWGMYSERLADEMGLYSSDIDRLGMITADAWRAARLVTDTGIHALGWTRRQAIDFIREWTPVGLLTTEQEVDRYIGMPGQALSYKMGQLEIVRLRREAETRLGAHFDIKGFHDTMLVHGAMPLPMLAESVDAWIETVGLG